LPLARTVSVARTTDDKAASGQSAVASAPGGLCASAASQDWSRRAHRRACMQRLASPTGGCDAGTGLAVSPTSVAAHPFTSTACPLPSLVCRAVGTQCP
ncbi:MAG: hypothetical protein ACXVBU_15140, partial [Ktedonobacteraceae bacterium]